VKGCGLWEEVDKCYSFFLGNIKVKQESKKKILKLPWDAPFCLGSITLLVLVPGTWSTWSDRT